MPRVRDLLMVEGKNDRHVVYAHCERHGVPETFEVNDYKGVEALFEAFPERIDESGRGRLGIVVDADPDIGLERRWPSVIDCSARDTRKYLGEPIPQAPSFPRRIYSEQS